MSSGVFPSVPPPHLDRPKLRKSRPEKDSRRRQTAIWLRQWFADHDVTQAMLEKMDVGSKGVIGEILSGRKSFQWDDLACIPVRHRAEFVTDYLAFIAQFDAPDAPKTFAQLRRHG